MPTGLEYYKDTTFFESKHCLECRSTGFESEVLEFDPLCNEQLIEMVEGHLNPGLFNPKLQPRTFEPQTFQPLTFQP